MSKDLQLYLTVGSQSLADAFDLHQVDDNNTPNGACFVLGGRYTSPTGDVVQGGVRFAPYERNPRAQSRYQAPAGTQPLYIGCFITGASAAALHAQTGLVLYKTEQALIASGPNRVGDRITLWYQRGDEAEWAFFDVLGGLITTFDTGLPSQTGFIPMLLRLDVLPFARRPAITTDAATGTLTAWTSGAQLYRGAVPSQVEALLTWQIADLSAGGKVITRIRAGLRHANPMLSTDFTGIYAGVTNAATDLNGAVTAGATSIVVDSASGFAAGSLLLIDSGGVQELATVANSYVSGTTIPLAAGLLYAHADEAVVVVCVTNSGQAQLCPPATKHADATAANGGGNTARVTASASWQSLLAIVPNSGAVQNGRFTAIARVRDASATIGALQGASLGTPTVTPGGGYLNAATYSAFYVPKNGANYGQPTGIVEATVENLQAGGSTGTPMDTLLYDRDQTSDFRYWTHVMSGAVASVSQTDWNSVSSPVFDLSAVSGTPVTAIGTSLQCAGVYGLPAVPTSKILSVRVRFKFTGALTAPASNTSATIIAVTHNAGSQISGLVNNNVSGTTNLTGTVNTGPGANAALQGRTVATDTTWHAIEITYDTTGTDTRIDVYYDGLPIMGEMIAPATSLNPLSLMIGDGTASHCPIYIGEVVIADQYLGPTLSVASGSSITFGITHASGEGSGFGDLFVQDGAGSGWYKVSSIGNVATYVLSQWPPPSSILQVYPVITPVYPALFRIGALTQGRSLRDVEWSRPVSAYLSNGEWEEIVFPPIDAPPVVRAEGQNQDPYLLILQCQGVAGQTPICDADAIALFPQEEDSLTAWWPPQYDSTGALIPYPSGGTWEIDTRYDGRARAVVRDSAGTVIGQPLVTGQMMLGPADNALVVVPSVADANGYAVSDAVNAKFALHLTRITPRSKPESIL